MAVAMPVLVGCAGTQPVAEVPAVGPEGRSAAHDATEHPIQHLIVIVQQYRTFDDLFSGYQGANAPGFV